MDLCCVIRFRDVCCLGACLVWSAAFEDCMDVDRPEVGFQLPRC